jgi:hypothetical protein
LLRELEELYIPTSERALRNVQRKGDELDKQIRHWAHEVVEVLPRGLPLNADEKYLVCLFLAQQRRINLQMDAYEPDTSFMGTVKQYFPFVGARPDPEAHNAIHRIVSLRLDSDIDRTARFFIEDAGVDPSCEPAIDWRVAMRFMAQSVYSRIGANDPKKVLHSPIRFELALIARDLAAEIVERRGLMLATSTRRPSPHQRRAADRVG